MASYAGASLSILSDPYGERILSKENFAVVKVSDAQDRRSACSRWLTNCIYQSLWRQRLFSSLLPMMIEGSKTQLGSTQTPYLLALGSTITIIPQGLITSHLSELLPLIMRGLTLSNPEIRYNMLRMLSSVLEVEGDAATGTLLRSQAKSLADVLVATATDLGEDSSSPVSRPGTLSS